MAPEDIRHIKTALALTREPVGIIFFHTPEDCRDFPADFPRHRLSYCMMVNLAASGRSLKVEDRHFKCDGARRALGFLQRDRALLSGDRYRQFGLYAQKQIAEQAVADMAFVRRKPLGLGIVPLHRAEVPVDVVLFICSPYAAMRLIQGYAFHYGMPKNIRMLGNQGVCSELTAKPYTDQDLNASLLCSNSRFSCRWKEGELGVGIPASMFARVADGVLQTLNATEPDREKEKIRKRGRALGVYQEVTDGTNYYASRKGVGKWPRSES